MPPRAKRDRLPEAIAFGKRLRQLREAAGWTLEELAEAAKMNELQVGHIERGASDPKLSTITKLAKALGISASELLRPPR
ncbi:MAG TPA: helix-turn-helix transcriptional regulator [Thermoanaerobaculia bacterium]|nr:helix-turn-helix transcriptional regulator [Thermoanaerobaculia bacterium]